MSEYRYEGQELDVFSQASHWKQYFKSIILPYIGNCVVEVGAGIGATTAVLCDSQQKQWVCLEPDEKFRQVIEGKINAAELPTCCSASAGFVAGLDLESTIRYLALHRCFRTHSKRCNRINRGGQAPG